MPFWNNWIATLGIRDKNVPRIVEQIAECEHDIEEPERESTGASDFLDGIVIAIGYRDSAGNFSRRDISALNLTEKNGFVYLQGICHLRNGYRSFRADRIEDIVTADGEVIVPIDFWKEIGVAAPILAALSAAPTSFNKPPARFRKDVELIQVPSPGLRQRGLVRHQVRILAALSRSDGNMRDEEVEEILEYICKECDECQLSFDEADLAALRAYVRRLRPTAEKIEESFEKLFKPTNETALESEQLRRLRKAMTKVINADKVLHPDEFAFMLDFEAWLGESSVHLRSTSDG